MASGPHLLIIKSLILYMYKTPKSTIILYEKTSLDKKSVKPSYLCTAEKLVKFFFANVVKVSMSINYNSKNNVT